MIYLRTSVGIEIREQDLLLSCLKSNFSAGVFTRFARIKDYTTRDSAEVAKELEQFFKMERFGRENVVLGIPRQDAIIRHLDLPKEVEDNLKQVVLYQVQSFEPTEEEKFYYDYVPLTPKQNGKRLLVMLVMIKKSILDAHLQSLRQYDLNPVMVTVGAVALGNLFLQTRPDNRQNTFLVADLKTSHLEVLALRNGTLVYSKESAREEGVSSKEILLREVEQAVANSRLGPEDTIEKIVLAGEDSEAAQRELAEDLIDCDLMSSQIKFEMSSPEQLHLQEASTSLGLAYSGMVRRPPMKLNLLPGELRVQQTRWAYVPSIILAVFIVGLLVALGFRQMVQEQILQRKVDQEITSLTGRVNQVQRIRAQVEALEKKILYVEGLVRKQDMNLEILQELTTNLPQDTFLNLYNNRDCTISLSGASSSAPDLIPKLERSPLLQNVVQRGTVFKDAQTGKDRFTFEAKCER